jgi:hypothetical protein
VTIRAKHGDSVTWALGIVIQTRVWHPELVTTMERAALHVCNTSEMSAISIQLVVNRMDTGNAATASEAGELDLDTN